MLYRVSAHLLDVPYSVDHAYSYRLERAAGDPLPHCGSLLRVPFGAGNRLHFALTVEAAEATEEECASLKTVHTVLEERYALSEEGMQLCRFLKERTLCTIGEAVHALLPAAVFTPADRKNIRLERIVSLAVPVEEASALLTSPDHPDRPHSPAQHRLLAYLVTHGATEAKVLAAATSTTTAQLAPLLRRHLLTCTENEVLRNPYAHLANGEGRTPILLSRAQTAAEEQLLALYETGAPHAALLFGVTGSGKTKVMMRMIDRVLDDGRSVIVMVPEIALTPQTVGLFCSRYGERVAVLHSALGTGERFDAWRRIAAGQVDLVIGTRSAVFAPLRNLGLIVIDEEQEHTYKSENSPKYHTRDVAAFRCAGHNALLLLASATPSVESFYKAKQGTYTLVPLRERYGGNALPQTLLVDMREELRDGNRSPLSTRLLESLAETHDAALQSILFLNRRGYNSSLHCKQCGEVIVCPHCSLSLTFHTGQQGGYLLCHCCGYRAQPPRLCPSCGAARLSYIGYGTQKVESELSQLLPDVRVLRMDADTATGKQVYDRMLEDFRCGRADVLLGTQMVTKGHDFPRVTLVGVLLADTALYVNDFRAAERTFSLLTQVIGRAGRADLPGVAVIQTFVPDNHVIELACRQDYEAFYEGEIALRRSMLFPPFCDMVQLTLSSSDEQALLAACAAVSRFAAQSAAEEYGEQPMQIFGPFEAQTYKVSNQYRMRLVIKCRLNARTREFFSNLLTRFGRERKVTLAVDFNPHSV